MPFKHRQDLDCPASDPIDDPVILFDELAQLLGQNMVYKQTSSNPEIGTRTEGNSWLADLR